MVIGDFGDGDEDGGDGDGDLYIMVKCMSVCLGRKSDHILFVQNYVKKLIIWAGGKIILEGGKIILAGLVTT